MRNLIFVVFIFALPSSSQACRLAISADALVGRIAKIAFVVEHASTQVANLQSGWNLSIMNEPSWKTSINGYAIVGAAFLSGSDFQSTFGFTPEPGFSCEDLQHAKGTVLTLTFYKGDRLILAKVDKRYLKFTL